jgi:ElaB/YqjD/DUF883 family membrane-anchored ribosome-binding protein
MSTSDERAALHDDIERTREQLGDSVEELAYRADVKAQAEEKVDELKARAKDTAESAIDTVRSQPARVVGVVAGFAALFGSLAWWRRRRAKARARHRRSR